VRMYRIGHGDCFLIAFDARPKPVHVLIDCGYKPGSPAFINTHPDQVVADIREVTGARLDVAIITHEHQDHVNAITKARFADFKIGQTWFAWTESEDDELAKRLRLKHHDTLKSLAAARSRLAADAAGQDLALKIDEFMSFEIGGDEATSDGSLALAASGGKWTNKDAMKLFRDLSEAPAQCIYPHREIIVLPGAEHVRVFAIGPPHSETEIEDLNPRKGEGFPKSGFAAGALPVSFSAAISEAPDTEAGQPFSARHAVKLDLMEMEPDLAEWLKKNCGRGDDPEEHAGGNPEEVAENAKFRRIDQDWLMSAEQLALAMGNDTNNSSLVLAFELGKGGKVLLFAGDAQRGNWASWAAHPFKDGDKEVDVRELLGRTVLYKAGHHGSHNATLAGTPADAHPNLSWLGRGKYASEFTAMITAVRAWAMQPSVGWDHPLKAIKEALVQKSSGRVFQTDTNFASMTKPDDAGDAAWSDFQKRASGGPLYFDLVINSE
jgi:beta-lactamase superfamily II metal-dependent hydrolase